MRSTRAKASSHLKTLPLPERFAAWTDKTCANGRWEWRGRLNKSGYGQVSHSGKARLAHRVAWELAHGPIPADMLVCHRCDNRKCVRPDHLFLGTIQDNNADMMRKGRHQALREEAHPCATVTREQVLEIRHLRADGASLKTIASRFGIPAKTVSSICRGISWRNVGGPRTTRPWWENSRAP